MERLRKIWRFTTCLCVGLCLLLNVEHTLANAASVVSQNTRPVPISTVEYNSLSESASAGKLGEIRCGEQDGMVTVLAVLGLLVLIAAIAQSNNNSTTN